jgi:phosphoglycolate phosphatase-like HAD superfamily hydrolase
MRYSHLIWDFDGTLFDTYPALISAIQRALADFDAVEADSEVSTLLRDTLVTCVATLTARHGLEPGAFEARVNYYWRGATFRDQPPMPGVIGACERVLKAGGSNYIFTHRSRESLVGLLDWYRVSGLFADCLTAGDGYARKPDPAGFLALMDRHHMPSDRVLAIGDRDLDILAGRAAGVRTCLYCAEPSPLAPPDYVIADYHALLVVVGAN